jgi:hypothetical protein
MYRSQLLTAILVIAALWLPARADLIVYGTHADHPIVPGGSLDDVRMRVHLDVYQGLATMTFTNESVAPETTAAFKEIVLDTYDDDTGTAILWGGEVLTHTADVDYELFESNGLPGYHQQTADPVPLAELRALPPPTSKGLNPGESLQLRFQTLLADYAGIDDYLGAFGAGQDTGWYSIGFHAINCDTVAAESLSGIYVPEPATLAVLILGGAAMLLRRTRSA